MSAGALQHRGPSTPPGAAVGSGRSRAAGGGPGAATVSSVYEIRGLEVTLGGRHVLGPLDLDVPRGSFLGVLGPNGSGKTTLLRALTGSARPSTGEILLEGRPIGRYRAAELARLVGVVPQQFNLDFSFTVEEMVAMGRYAHTGWVPGRAAGRVATIGAGAAIGTSVAADPGATTGPAAADGAAVAAALEATGTTPLADRLVTELSGGERQRALVAQTLAQDTPVLLLDEPLNNLDLNHQLEIMQLLSHLHASGRTIVVVLHDLNMAAQYCEQLMVLDQGRVAARGTPNDILDPRVVLEVFKVRVAVHRQGRRPYITPVWSRTPAVPLAGGQTRVHVIGGGGAASELVEELVARGFTPSVGIVSVFDTDYATAQRYELQMVSAPPFEPFPPEAVREFETFADEADVIIVAPVFFGKGNLAPLQTALRAAQAGKRVVVVGQPSLAERDLSGGEATRLVAELVALGALDVEDSTQAVDLIAGS